MIQDRKNAMSVSYSLLLGFSVLTLRLVPYTVCLTGMPETKTTEQSSPAYGTFFPSVKKSNH